MGRSGYCEDIDNNWDLIMWRGAVASAIRGRRGQAFLKEMLAAMDALPKKELIDNELIEEDGAVCAIGAVGKMRGIDMSKVDPEDQGAVANLFGVSRALACEIFYMNDEGVYRSETPEQRFERMRKWIQENINSSQQTVAG